MRALSARSSKAFARAESDIGCDSIVADVAPRLGVLLPPPSDGWHASTKMMHDVSRLISRNIRTTAVAAPPSRHSFCASDYDYIDANDPRLVPKRRAIHRAVAGGRRFEFGRPGRAFRDDRGSGENQCA